MFRLEINMDNAAFGETDEDRAQELGRILDETSIAIVEHAEARGIVRDINGNTVGHWKITDEP